MSSYAGCVPGAARVPVRDRMSYAVLGVLLGLGLLLTGCGGGGGDNGTLTPGGASSESRFEVQAIEQLLSLYRTALLHEDIDRLAELLVPVGTATQASTAAGASVSVPGSLRQEPQTLLEEMRDAFGSAAQLRTAVVLQDMQLASDRRSLAFLETTSLIRQRSLEDIEQQTQCVRVTMQIAQGVENGSSRFRIAALQRTLLAVVTTQGRLQPGAPSRVEVAGTTALFALTGVEVEVPETGVRQALTLQGERFQGLLSIPPQPASPAALRVSLHGPQGETLTFAHAYQVHRQGDGVVQRLPGTETLGAFFAVTVGPDGTVWAGGRDSGASRGGPLYKVPPGTTTVQLVDRLLADPTSRLTDLTFDSLGRLHATGLVSGGTTFASNMDVVLDRGVLCGTANVFDALQSYPLLGPDPDTGSPQPRPFTRLTSAGAGDVWLVGSEGGLARARDTFRDGVCPATGVSVQYEAILRRETSTLPTNVVQALAASADGSLWIGTALGLVRWQQGVLTPVPFSTVPVLPGNVTTLERFFAALAEAIFAAQPLTTVALGEVRFAEVFGGSLRKADLISSVVEAPDGGVWVGTYGGGLRRVATHGATPGDTLTVTHEGVTRLTSGAAVCRKVFTTGLVSVDVTNATPNTDACPVDASAGLISNLVSALAVGPDGAVWVATPKGVSRVTDQAGTVQITNFSSLDGVTLPVRDVAVDAAGVAWLATDGGLVRIIPHGGTVQGSVRDTAGRALEGVDVLVPGTPLRTVTDATGRFTLAALPPGQQTLRLVSPPGAGGPFTTALRTVEAQPGQEQTLAITLVPLAIRVPVDPAQGGTVTFPSLPEARLTILPQSFSAPQGEPNAIGLTPLPLDSLPLPVPAESTAVAAVDLQPLTALLSPPAQLTLPNTTGLAAGRLLVVLSLDESTASYKAIGLARVSGDGRTISTTSAVLQRLAVIVLVTTSLSDETRLVVVSGDDQTGTVGQPLPQPLVVKIQDGSGTGIAEVPVTFEVFTGGGSLAAATTRSDAQGQASSVLTLGTQAGTNRVIARALGLDQGQFTALGRADRQNARLVEVSGNNQSGRPGATLPEPLVVRLEDQFRNPLALEEMRAESQRGQATLTPAVGTTNAQGEASFRVQIGSTTTDLLVLQFAALNADPVQFIGSVGFGLDAPGDVAVQADGVLVVVDQDLGVVKQVDPTTGSVRIVPGVGRGTDRLFGVPQAVAIDETNGSLVVVELATTATTGVVRVVPGTGQRTVLSNQSIGTGPTFRNPKAIALETQGTVLVIDQGLRAVIRVDPRNGDRTLVSGPSVGSGPDLVGPNGFAVDSSGMLWVADTVLAALLRIDPLTGRRTIVSDATLGSGPLLAMPQAVALEVDGTLAVVDGVLRAVVRVQPQTGNRTIVSGCRVVDVPCAVTDLTGRGPLFVSPEAVARRGAGPFWVVDALLRLVMRVEPVSGQRFIVHFLGP